jgi:hypothetical protein
MRFAMNRDFAPMTLWDVLSIKRIASWWQMIPELTAELEILKRDGAEAMTACVPTLRRHELIAFVHAVREVAGVNIWGQYLGRFYPPALA